MWISSGRVANPVLDQVLLDTGALAAKERLFQIYIASSVALITEVQWRNAANTATLKSQIIPVPATTFIQMFPFLQEIPMLDNERIRIIAVAAVTGNTSVSIDYTA